MPGALDTIFDMSGNDVGASDAWRVGVLLRQTHQRKHREIDLALAPLGTSMSQYVALLFCSCARRRAVQPERDDSPSSAAKPILATRARMWVPL